MKDQFSYANTYEIPVAVVIGENELAKNEIGVKNLPLGDRLRREITDNEEFRRRSREAQVTVPRGELVKTVRRMLE